MSILQGVIKTGIMGLCFIGLTIFAFFNVITYLVKGRIYDYDR